MAELTLTEKEKSELTFLEWDDAALGKACKKVAIILADSEGKKAIPTTAALVFLINNAREVGAQGLTLDLEGVTCPEPLGSWKLTLEQTSSPIPSTVDGAIAQLVAEAIAHQKEVTDLSNSGKGVKNLWDTGLNLRNRYGLWTHESLIKKDAVGRFKLAHADDISGLILRGVMAKLKGETLNLDEAAQVYHDHWAMIDSTSLIEGGWEKDKDAT